MCYRHFYAYVTVDAAHDEIIHTPEWVKVAVGISADEAACSTSDGAAIASSLNIHHEATYDGKYNMIPYFIQ